MWIAPTLLISLGVLTVQTLGNHPDGISKRQILGGEACMHIYSVPKALTKCEPTEETSNRLTQLQDSLAEKQASLDELRAMIGELDPNQPKVLSDDVRLRLEAIDEVQRAQAGHNELVKKLESELGHVMERLRTVEASDRAEMSRLIELQTQLVRMTLKQNNRTLHEEYVDRLGDVTTDLLQRLQQLELDFRDRVHMAETTLDADLKKTEELSRDSLEDLKEKLDEALFQLEQRIAKEAQDRIGALNQTLSNAQLVEKLENQVTLLRERQAQYDYRDTTLREEVSQLEAQLSLETEEKEKLAQEAQELRTAFEQIKSEMAQYSNLSEKFQELVEVVGDRKHLSPRTLKVVDCQEALTYYHPVSGVYDINPFSHTKPYEVYCEMDSDTKEGWTVIQRRQDGAEDFFRGWNDYKSGFGDVSGEHWIGLHLIHKLTKERKYRLRIEMEDWDGKWWDAEYDHFYVDGEEENYRLHVSGFHGSAGDSLVYHDNMPFSTMDRNNDENDGVCATWCHGAWWYRSCFLSNLNGRYYNRGPYVTNTSWGDGVVWRYTHGTNYYSLKSVVMKIKSHSRNT